jgi:hypothetical protein
MAPYPEWLHILAWAYIGVSLACSLGLAIHTWVEPQNMRIMGLVWPITALYMGPVAVYMYRKALPVMEKKPMTPQMKTLQERFKGTPPTLFQNILAVYHCGSGCSIGDLPILHHRADARSLIRQGHRSGCTRRHHLDHTL